MVKNQPYSIADHVGDINRPYGLLVLKKNILIMAPPRQAVVIKTREWAGYSAG